MLHKDLRRAQIIELAINRMPDDLAARRFHRRLEPLDTRIGSTPIVT